VAQAGFDNIRFNICHWGLPFLPPGRNDTNEHSRKTIDIFRHEDQAAFLRCVRRIRLEDWVKEFMMRHWKSAAIWQMVGPNLD